MATWSLIGDYNLIKSLLHCVLLFISEFPIHNNRWGIQCYNQSEVIYTLQRRDDFLAPTTSLLPLILCLQDTQTECTCIGLNMVRVPQDMPTEIERLHMKTVGIVTLRTNALRNYPKITDLWVANFSIIETHKSITATSHHHQQDPQWPTQVQKYRESCLWASAASEDNVSGSPSPLSFKWLLFVLFVIFVYLMTFSYISNAPVLQTLSVDTFKGMSDSLKSL